MGQVMLLIDVVDNIRSLDVGDTIYLAEPWTESSRAIVAPEPISGGLPSEASALGLEYFLEVSVAMEFLEGLAENGGHDVDLRAKTDRLILYAINDA